MTHPPDDPLAAYLEAPALTDLRAWSRTETFARIPDDWQVFVADVENSTRAIEQGRYKHVNVVGTACIVAATNACGRDDIPFVFGGDGAAVVVPPVYADRVAAAWRGLRARVQESFGLQLRVGAVPVATLRVRGADLRVARRRLPLGSAIALFAGGGVSMAESLVKSEPDRHALPGTDAPPTSVEGLECRWNDVASRKGRIMTLLVRVRGDDPAVLAEVMARIDRALPAASPVALDNLPAIWPPRHLGIELALRRPPGWRRRFLHLGLWLECLFFGGLMRRQRRDPSARAGRYAAELVTHTDHVKLDDAVRAVLDVTPQEGADIEAMLQRLQAEGRLDYGLHYSDHALMTCFVRSLQSHLHFVDGAAGGYSVAAARLKASGASAARIICMGVAGCGKSSLGAAIASAEGLPFFEGDDFHSPESRAKMAGGIPLDDADRAQWLRRIGEQLAAHPQGMVGTCSALKRAYRDQLRSAAPGLRFVFLDLPRETALQRVSARAGHFFSPALVDSQFATLEPPRGEPGVLCVDAREPLAEARQRVHEWLRQGGG